VIKPKSRFFGHSTKHWQRAVANYFTLDGVSANFGVTAYISLVQTAGGALPALSALGGTNSLVSVDAMQEFRIQTSSFAPEFGRTPGGTFPRSPNDNARLVKKAPEAIEPHIGPDGTALLPTARCYVLFLVRDSSAATPEAAERISPRGQTKQSRPGREEKSTQAALHAVFCRDSEDKCLLVAVFLFSAGGQKGIQWPKPSKRRSVSMLHTVSTNNVTSVATTSTS
jgi:hypothetical protein